MYYEPIQSERYYEMGRKYSDVVWENFAEVVEAFDRRIRGWYIEPVGALIKQSSHSSFAVMAMTCLIIDALSQYRYGELSSSGRHFEQFAEDFLPSYKGLLPDNVNLMHYDYKYNEDGRQLTKYAQIL